MQIHIKGEYTGRKVTDDFANAGIYKMLLHEEKLQRSGDPQSISNHREIVD
jgi:hypothetical protein